nr:hypothetical protein [uncultured Trichococcus sp.]
MSECNVVEPRVSAVRHVSCCVQPTLLGFVGFSVFFALCSADAPAFRRLFGNLRSPFSQHPGFSLAVLYHSFHDQPTPSRFISKNNRMSTEKAPAAAGAVFVLLY